MLRFGNHFLFALLITPPFVVFSLHLNPFTKRRTCVRFSNLFIFSRLILLNLVINYCHSILLYCDLSFSKDFRSFVLAVFFCAVMAAANVLLTISHVVDFSDNPRCRQSPCIYFWGTTDDRNHLIQLEHCIEVIKPILDGSPPPMHHNMLGDLVCCALVKNRWVRAKLTDSKMDHQGMLEVICIDSGTQSSVPLGFLRSLQIPGREATTLREWPPLASKFILADVVAPRGEWSESALIFLKSRLENHTWKAATLGCYNGYTGINENTCWICLF